MSDLHGQIMNILADANKAGTDDVRLAYLHGHRDARHAAAELANAAVVDLDELRALLCSIDANMRRAWKDGSLSADAWPTDLAQRVSRAVG
jgi:hypothetical protein